MWSNQKIKTESLHSIGNGLLLLKGGDLAEELKEYGRPYAETSLKEFFEEEFFETKKIVYVPL